MNSPEVPRQPLHVGRPNLGNREKLLARWGEVLERNWLTNDGPFVREFERRIADYVGVRHCVAMCNATVALEIGIRALGLCGEVLVPSFTFVATAHALQWQEITPIFCDIDPVTHNIDPACVERAITPRTTGIIGVHLWGRACPVDALVEIADRRGLTLMFDAAHAFGCSHRGRMIGSFGRAEVFSFHATKFINSGEGGAVVTDDDELAEKIRLMRNFGFAGYDNVIYIGTNGKMNELSAAMGVTSLESIDEFLSVNVRNYRLYADEIGRIPGLDLLTYDPSERNNHQYIVVEVDAAAYGCNRDEIVARLHEHGILSRRNFHPGCHRMEPYRSSTRHAPFPLVQTERMAERVMLLPTGTAVGESEIRWICGLLREFRPGSATKAGEAARGVRGAGCE